MAVGKFMQRASQRDYSKHWAVPGTFPWIIQQPKPPITGRPIRVKDNYIRAVKGEQPYWIPCYFYESNTIWPDAIEEHPVPEKSGYDWWGVDWEMVDSINGMITKPGTRTISDFSKWKEELEWPDISQVDFEADGKKIQKDLDPDRVHIYQCTEGIFERLHEMIPFAESLMAFYEEPDLLAEFFDKMADYKIETTQKIFDYYGRVDGVLYHDDWGTERAGFFSNEMFDEQLLPYEKKFLRDFVKKSGRFVELHSCGRNGQYLPEMIEMGVDYWNPQHRANDYDELFEKWNTQMSFAFDIDIPHGADEEEIRKRVRDFVDHFGGNGRILASIMTDFTDPSQTDIARDELYHYSLEYYNKLYHRNSNN